VGFCTQDRRKVAQVSEIGDVISNAGFPAILEVFGGTALSYTQGVTNITITDSAKGAEIRSETPGNGLDRVECLFHVAAAQFTGGMIPSPGDDFTEGGKTWEVTNVDFEASVYELTCSRRTQRAIA